MKNRKIWITVLIVLVIASSPFMMWKFKPSRILNVIIIDKTVPSMTYREHKGFMWVLNNLKIKNGSPDSIFNYDKNYFGFFPLSNEEYMIKELPVDIGKPDLIYITDTYGVYEGDLSKKDLSGNRSDIIYGGTKEKEISIIKKALSNNVIIGEFNTMASPTDTMQRKSLENLFGLEWNGWIGRYFSDLSKENMELPYWMQENYALQYGEKWDFEGSGIVLANSEDSIIVLRSGVDLGVGLNKISFSQTAKDEFEIKKNTNYYYWFEITKAKENSEVLANYKLDVTKEGQKLLDEFNLPSEFPAVVRKTGNYTGYYFAGDFADSNSAPRIYSASGIDFLNKMTALDEESNQNYFYWNVYYPLIKNIVKKIN